MNKSQVKSYNKSVYNDKKNQRSKNIREIKQLQKVEMRPQSFKFSKWEKIK